MGRALWLDDVIDDQQAQQVCWEHAAALSVPRGWTVTDRRSPDAIHGPPGAAEPRDESPPEPPPLPQGPSRPGGLVGQSDPSGQSDPRGPGPGPSAGGDGAPRRADQAERPRPRLLERALEWTGDQRSAITERGPGPGGEPDAAAPEGAEADPAGSATAARPD